MKRITRHTVTAENALSYNGRSGSELMAMRDQSASHTGSLVLCKAHGMQKVTRLWGSRLILACGCRRAAESYDTAHLKAKPTTPAGASK